MDCLTCWVPNTKTCIVETTTILKIVDSTYILETESWNPGMITATRYTSGIHKYIMNQNNEYGVYAEEQRL
jgi:hypothetical protein